MKITEAIRNLNTADAHTFEEHRTLMRRAYMNAHMLILGDNQWSKSDSDALDEIDRQIVGLMQRSGRNLDDKFEAIPKTIQQPFAPTFAPSKNETKAVDNGAKSA